VLMRPNAATMSVLPFIAACASRFKKPGLVWLAIYLGSGLAVYMTGSLIATGHAFYWPSNGPYNLAAGNNPFAMYELLHHQNGEPSLPAALASAGMGDVDPYSVTPETYARLSIAYVLDHPIRCLELVAVKIMVLFSPRLFNADTTFKVLTQSLLLYPVAAYLVAVFGRIKAKAFARSDCLMLGMVVLFVFPFAITNADPRLRMPLDLALLAMACVWFDERLARLSKNR